MGMIDYLGRPSARRALLRGEIPRWIANSKSRRGYIIQVLLSCPPWANLQALRSIQARARWETQMSGEQWSVDHIVPLRHPLVCGLTVPWNLCVIREKVNNHKNNKWSPGQMELWTESEAPRHLGESQAGSAHCSRRSSRRPQLRKT